MNFVDKKKVDYFDKYTFLCEMYDEHAFTIRELVLNFFPFDNSVQVIDAKRGMSLLKRTRMPEVEAKSFQIGSIVNIFSKLLLIIDSAPVTKRTLFKDYQNTFCLVMPIPAEQHGKVITFLNSQGFRINRMRKSRITKEFALLMYSKIKEQASVPALVDSTMNGEVIGLDLVAPNSVEKLQKCIGDKDPQKAAPGTLNYLLGRKAMRTIAHGSEDADIAAKCIQHFFGFKNGLPMIPYSATFKDCTLCLIKPHARSEGLAGEILELITSSKYFYISAMALFGVGLTDAKEFYEIYKGVVSEYEEMCIELAGGKTLALEVKCKEPGMNVVCEFRKFCGVRDPDVCRMLYPDTLRAKFGRTIVNNAVHCTDLPEDGEDEVEYFFKLLANNSET